MCVDGVMVADEFVLMELELMESGPMLDAAPSQARVQFARAITQNIPLISNKLLTMLLLRRIS